MLIILVILVIVVTAINNWLIPVLIYRKKFGLFKQRPAGFVGCNFWGVIMDVFLAGCINLVVANYYLTYGLNINFMLGSLILSVLATMFIHVLMAVKPWKVWIMPSPWKWNEAGYWHMFSMFAQFAYGFYPLVLISQKPDLLYRPETVITLAAAGLFGILFLVSLRYCNRGAQIGPLYISGEPW